MHDASGSGTQAMAPCCFHLQSTRRPEHCPSNHINLLLSSVASHDIWSVICSAGRTGQQQQHSPECLDVTVVALSLQECRYSLRSPCIAAMASAEGQTGGAPPAFAFAHVYNPQLDAGRGELFSASAVVRCAERSHLQRGHACRPCSRGTEIEHPRVCSCICPKHRVSVRHALMKLAHLEG